MLALLAGAAMLSWPALVNGYPLVFSDTAGIASMGLEPNMGWDKPWVYGPLILLVHGGLSLWGVVAAQAVLVSIILWRVGISVGAGGCWSHVVLCALLASGSAAPWFVTLVMPDIFAPLVVLGITLLASRSLRPVATGCIAVLVAVAIASHLAHLIIAAGCVVAVAMLQFRRLLVCVVPLGLALAWLVGSNVVGNGVVGVSPYGSVFALARLQADGPAADYIHSVCPQARLRLCEWSDQLPMDSDVFLWEPTGPVWAHDFGPILFTPEASQVVAATLRYEPLAATQHAALNTLRQLGRVAVGDTLGPDYLDATVGLLLRTYFPATELARLLASRQVSGTLRTAAKPFALIGLLLLCAGAMGTLLLVPFAWRRHPSLAVLATTVLLGILANAFATGALSGPHDRYGARIAWLVLLPPFFAVTGAWQRRRGKPLVSRG